MGLRVAPWRSEQPEKDTQTDLGRRPRNHAVSMSTARSPCAARVHQPGAYREAGGSSATPAGLLSPTRKGPTMYTRPGERAEPPRPEDFGPDDVGPHPEVERSGRSKATMVGLVVVLALGAAVYVSVLLVAWLG
jgi:hypothetical protein